MVIIFSCDKARNYLLEHGEVYTFRFKRRKRIGNDWMTDKRGGKKICDVTIQEIGKFLMLDLKPYVKLSGFSRLNEWIDEIVNLNSKFSDRGWLYKVTKK